MAEQIPERVQDGERSVPPSPVQNAGGPVQSPVRSMRGDKGRQNHERYERRNGDSCDHQRSGPGIHGP